MISLAAEKLSNISFFPKRITYYESIQVGWEVKEENIREIFMMFSLHSNRQENHEPN